MVWLSHKTFIAWALVIAAALSYFPFVSDQAFLSFHYTVYTQHRILLFVWKFYQRSHHMSIFAIKSTNHLEFLRIFPIFCCHLSECIVRGADWETDVTKHAKYAFLWWWSLINWFFLVLWYADCYLSSSSSSRHSTNR